VGLRCACVPIFYGKTLVGTAKFVVGRDTPTRRFSIATRVLELVVSRVCSDFHVSALAEELEAARRQVAELLKTPRSAYSRTDRDGGAAEAQPAPAPVGSLVDRTLALLSARYLDRSLSLVGISRALAVNDKYLTRLFTRVVGQHMHEYIVSLRVHHACRLLLSCDRPIKEIAFESGFRSPDRFRRAFRGNVGVAPTTYRRIFTAN
jgi:AraC-like DNA-binding protein